MITKTKGRAPISLRQNWGVLDQLQGELQEGVEQSEGEVDPKEDFQSYSWLPGKDEDGFDDFDPNEVLRKAALDKAKQEGIKLENLVIPEVKLEQLSDFGEDYFDEPMANGGDDSTLEVIKSGEKDVFVASELPIKN